MQKYWDNVSEERKKAHVEKMSKGMQDAWDSADDEFGPKIANRKNLKFINGMYIQDVPRINDYAGVLTFSEMVQL